jgi:hypothetical protein
LLKVMKASPFTIHEVVQLATARQDAKDGTVGALCNKELNAALSAVAVRKEKIDPRALSWFCRHWKDRFIGGMRLRCASRKGTSQSKWRIEGEPAPAAEIGDANEPAEAEPPDIDFAGDLSAFDEQG